MSVSFCLFLLLHRAARLFQAILATQILCLLLSLEKQQQLTLLALYLLLERCPLLQYRSLCEQLVYHHQTALMGLYWSFEILFSGLIGFFWGLDPLYFLLIAHAALLGRLFNLCLLFELPHSLAQLLCCLIALPWLILIASSYSEISFLSAFLGGTLMVMLFFLIWLAPVLLKWHIEPFHWEVIP